MFKRPDKEPHFWNPSKRVKIENLEVPVQKNKTSKQNQCDDDWGDDFDEEQIEQIVSQACIEENTIETTTQPCVSENLCNTNFETTRDLNYSVFKQRVSHSSTFHPGHELTTGNSESEELQKLKIEKEKLLNEFKTKEGEILFLRNQLQMTQSKISNEKLEKIRLVEQQENKHKIEIEAINNEKERLKTQLELQALEMNKLLDRCKLLELGNIKLTEPHTANMSTIKNKALNVSGMFHRSISNKQVHLKESAVQVDVQKKQNCVLKTSNDYYPFAKLPALIFERSLPEKSVIDIKITEKIGKRNLPILREEETFRIFENPDLGKSITTRIDNKTLSTDFILPDLALLQKKTSSEIDSILCIPIINKLVAMTRELLLNLIVVLRSIYHAMKNDDIRDMNDVYFSDLYEKAIPKKSLFDSRPWYDQERGIESRRALGILGLATAESTYLSNYITGKSKLIVENDTFYQDYSQKMVQYNLWENKGAKFEMLEIILEFVKLLGLVRRAHQFSGLVIAIAEVLCNAQEKSGFPNEGIVYVSSIFKELVYSRPLSVSYDSLAGILKTFAENTVLLQSFCTNLRKMAINNWQDGLHFTPDVCSLQVLLTQFEYLGEDSILRTASALTSFAHTMMQSKWMSLKIENGTCDCHVKLLTFTIKLLWKSSKLKFPKQQNEEERKLQTIVLRKGLTFFCHLAIYDPDFITRCSDVEDPFHLFLRNIQDFEKVIVSDNERECMNKIKSTFLPEKAPQCSFPQQNVNLNKFNIMTNFERNSGNSFNKNRNLSRTFAAIKGTIRGSSN